VTDVPIPITDGDGDGPPYARLRDAIRHRIERGELLPGDKLPTVRACAERLGLAPNTVARAYRELEGAGWIAGRGRAGTFVADEVPNSDAPEDQLASAAQTYLRRAERLGFTFEQARRALERG
jgi:DNA-binding transcriptional regulator YhcF (GntR family)